MIDKVEEYPPVEPEHMDMSDMPYACPHTPEHSLHRHIYAGVPKHYDGKVLQFGHYYDCDPSCNPVTYD